MLTYPEIDPVAFSFGPLTVHWYGLTYLFAFASAWWLAITRCEQPWSPIKKSQVEDLVVYGALGVVLGGRLGYVFFYNLEHFLQDPLWLLRIWEGGMSFHGGLLGVAVAVWLYSRKLQTSFLRLGDFVVPMVPLGLGFGRLGNFIGQELWGRAADVPWAMIFPRDPHGVPRHPSQLYQFALEGLLLFVLIFWFSKKQRPAGSIGGLFLVGYGCARFFVEFFREPDAHIGFDLLGWMSRGQLLSIPMILIGLGIIAWAYHREKKNNQNTNTGETNNSKTDNSVKAS
ncbi:MAG: prolipoprotein diacylglyceryl transferase [Cellvibrionaceae bacterium]